MSDLPKNIPSQVSAKQKAALERQVMMERLEPPPRSLPWSLWVTLWIGGWRAIGFWLFAPIAVVTLRIGIEIRDWMFLLFLVPLCSVFALIMLVWSIRESNRRTRLFRYGKLAQGKFLQKTLTNEYGASKREIPLFEYSLSFLADNGQEYTCIEKTIRPEELDDEEKEYLLYLPENPEIATTWDGHHVNPTISERGKLVQPNGFELWVLIMPIFLLFVCCVVIFWSKQAIAIWKMLV